MQTGLVGIRVNDLAELISARVRMSVLSLAGEMLKGEYFIGGFCLNRHLQ